MPAASSRGAQQREQARELREDERLVPFVDAPRASCGSSTSNFADGSSRAARIDQPGWHAAWRSRSSASSTCIFDSLTPSRAMRAEQRRPIVRRAARRRARAARPSSSQCIVCSVRARQLRRDLLLGAAQDERPQRARAAIASVLVVARRAPRWRAGRPTTVPSRPGFRNSNRLHSSPRWFSIGVPLSASRCRARSSRAAFAAAVVGVLDRLRLVEDRVVELDVLQTPRRRAAACRRSSGRCRSRSMRPRIAQSAPV